MNRLLTAGAALVLVVGLQGCGGATGFSPAAPPVTPEFASPELSSEASGSAVATTMAPAIPDETGGPAPRQPDANGVDPEAAAFDAELQSISGELAGLAMPSEGDFAGVTDGVR